MVCENGKAGTRQNRRAESREPRAWFAVRGCGVRPLDIDYQSGRRKKEKKFVCPDTDTVTIAVAVAMDDHHSSETRGCGVVVKVRRQVAGQELGGSLLADLVAQVTTGKVDVAGVELGKLGSLGSKELVDVSRSDLLAVGGGCTVVDPLPEEKTRDLGSCGVLHTV